MVVGSLGVSAWPGGLSAQQDPEASRVQHRNNCRLAAQILTTGHPRNRRDWALDYAGNCANDAPAAIAKVWQEITGSDAGLDRLVVSSMYVRDRRIYDQVHATATDLDRPVNVRTAAMEVLVKYVDPESSIRPGELVPPDSIRNIRMVLGSTTRWVQMEGSEPVGNEIGPEVLSLLERLAADRTGQPRGVWYAAARLAPRVRWKLERQSPP